MAANARWLSALNHSIVRCRVLLSRKQQDSTLWNGAKKRTISVSRWKLVATCRFRVARIDYQVSDIPLGSLSQAEPSAKELTRRAKMATEVA